MVIQIFFEDVSSCVLVDRAKVPLQSLATQVLVESRVSVHCRSTVRLTGKLTISIAPIARSFRIPTRSYKMNDVPLNPTKKKPQDLLHVGQQLIFEILIILSMVATEAIPSNIVFKVYIEPQKIYLHSLLSISDTQKLEENIIVLPKRPQDFLTRVQICEITPKKGYKPTPIECSE
ncbi:hypothetical protein G6F56_000061 [Rhizopus delemar]|nr:hypothetical protein G6F56_000061 [Rhizopus delemar]